MVFVGGGDCNDGVEEEVTFAYVYIEAGVFITHTRLDTSREVNKFYLRRICTRILVCRY